MTAPLPRPPVPAPAGDYERWLAENPARDPQAFIRDGDYRRLPPDVWESFTPEQQALVKEHGSYQAVTPQEWPLRDQLMANWQAWRRSRTGDKQEHDV
jgi:hypothetical protein